MKSFLGLVLSFGMVVSAFGEARTPIAKLPFVIKKSGNYYVTKDLLMKTRPDANVNGAIQILANNVDLDLNGRTLEVDPALDGSPSTKYVAVFVTALRNVTVRNGSIRGWLNGVNMGGNVSPSGPARCENLMIYDCLNYGILLYRDDAVVRGCSLRNIVNGLSMDVRGNGSLIQKTSVAEAAGEGIYVTGGGSIVEDCHVLGKSKAVDGTTGIYVSGKGVVQRCYAEGCYIGALTFEAIVRDNTFVNCTAPFGGPDGGGNK